MNRQNSLQKMTAAALLIALGIIIPMFSPIKLIIEPAASFTLASHVAVFLAMFISPTVAAAVALGTTLGFALNPVYGPIVVLRAASHIVFALGGSTYLTKWPNTLASAKKTQVFSLAVGLVHAVCEISVVSLFYAGGSMSDAHYTVGFLRSVILVIGLGTVAHSMVDFAIAWLIYKGLIRSRQIGSLFVK